MDNKQEAEENDKESNAKDSTVQRQGKSLEKRSDTMVIIVDSMVKNLDGSRMRTKYGEKVFVESFLGATIDDMSFHTSHQTRNSQIV